ncbi:hypothetical protein [Mucilaginibacter sp. dw_454]|uniref:hypothetical protein n=1 Tax=Mucilaginibacter sp. dw_454 TaxID=2720079 RepID=UPI001BD58B66|nr:hypothetical protein [Mucilaginibacter sp. dw_454]
MKNLFVCICCALAFGAQAQSTITRSYPVKAGEPINFKFDYPTVKISTWDKNEISVVAKIDLNDAEKNDYFSLEEQELNGVVTISNHTNFDKIPRQYSITRNGVKTFYKTKQEYKDAQKLPGVTQSNEGANIDAVVEIKVPAGCATNIKATYGMVEIANFNAPITVDDTYGGVDATINTAHTGTLKATTRFGEILSNLDMKITAHEKRDFFNSITADAGNNKSACVLSSDYGKIYLRKP